MNDTNNVVVFTLINTTTNKARHRSYHSSLKAAQDEAVKWYVNTVNQSINITVEDGHNATMLQEELERVLQFQTTEERFRAITSTILTFGYQIFLSYAGVALLDNEIEEYRPVVNT
jgi:hypothetical protein